MEKFTVVHIDAARAEHPLEEAELAKANARLVSANCESDDAVIAAAHHADGILCTWRPTTRAIFAVCPRLKVVVRYGIGFDNIDLEAATEHGVVVCNVTDYCIDEVATHAMTLLLALNRRLVLHNAAARSGERAGLSPSGRLVGETLGLVAFGNIARAVVKRARPFGLQVIAYDPYVEPARAAELGVELVSLDDVMARSDYVSVHPPLNDETRGLVGAEQLARMKPTAFLVTTCRGGVVDERALYEALKAGELAGAGVDVWDPEPVKPDNALLELDSVIATPHSAFYSDASLRLLQQRVGEAAADVLRGVMPRSVVNSAVLEQVPLKARAEA